VAFLKMMFIFSLPGPVRWSELPPSARRERRKSSSASVRRGRPYGPRRRPVSWIPP